MKFADPDNRYIQEVILNQEYSFLNYYPTVIDCGANIGTFSFWIYDHADKIYAIEPSKENIISMQETIKLNDLKKIIVTECAISNSNGVKKILRDGEAKLGGWRLDEAGDYPITCYTLEEFMKGRDIPYADLVKIDTEGEELKILQSFGFPHEKVGTIIGEFHSNIDRVELKKTFEWLGYKYYEIKGHFFLARHL
jgi:FkbM family methyltransferase